MDDFQKMIDEISQKTEYSDQEIDNMYYVYSRNLLIGYYEFKYIDETMSDLFLNLSKMMVDKLARRNGIGQQENIEEIVESKFDNLPENEKNEIRSEIEEIEKQLM